MDGILDGKHMAPIQTACSERRSGNREEGSLRGFDQCTGLRVQAVTPHSKQDTTAMFARMEGHISGLALGTLEPAMTSQRIGREDPVLGSLPACMGSRKVIAGKSVLSNQKALRTREADG